MKRKDIRPAIMAAIQASAEAVLAAAPIVLDSRSKAATTQMETHIQGLTGFVIAIAPLLGSRGIGAVRQRFAEKAHVAIHFRTNQENATSVALIEERTDAIIAAVLGTTELRAEFAGEQTTSLIPEDLGCLTYSIEFLIPFTGGFSAST